MPLLRLPQNIGQRLPKLKTLNMKGCWGIAVLPDSIGQLGNLEHLNLKMCHCLKFLPNAIMNLRKLKTLIIQNSSDMILARLNVCLRSGIADLVRGVGSGWFRLG